MIWIKLLPNYIIFISLIKGIIEYLHFLLLTFVGNKLFLKSQLALHF